MLKERSKKIYLILSPIIIVICWLIAFDKYLNFKISEIYNDSAIGKVGEIEERDKGTHLLKLDSSRNHLFFIGSSELRSWVPQNAKSMFPNTECPSDITVLGMPLVQSLQDAIRIGAIGDNLKNKNVCLMISMQWFMQKDGISKDQFKPHFSKIQFYEFLKNKNISENSKRYICERLDNLLYSNDETNPFTEEWLYAKLYQKKFLSNLFFPYYYLKNDFLLLKDKYNSFKMIQKYKDLPKSSEIKQIKWESEEQKAYEMGKKACTTNNFFISDSDWNGSLAPIINNLKMAYKDIDLQNSKEYEDLNLLFDICKQCGIKPYVIILSNNGFYYDYTGINSNKRNEFYERIADMCKNFNFDYLNLRDKEYEPYFFRDGMHLGWRGWLYVNNKVTEYFKIKG